MPGHMNVLLAEADVPYESLDDLDAANAKFSSADVALVVGANDVVNPAARTIAQPAVRDADPQRRPGNQRGVHETEHAARVSPGWTTALYDPKTGAALRRRQGLADQAGGGGQVA